MAIKKPDLLPDDPEKREERLRELGKAWFKDARERRPVKAGVNPTSSDAGVVAWDISIDSCSGGSDGGGCGGGGD